MAKAIVKSVDPDSIAYDCGIEPGDKILKINNREFADVLDFRYLTSDDYYVVEVEKTDGSVEEIEIYNDLYEQFGCDFENELLDSANQCRNKCIFCFMDQLPPNMRETMYFKDDDVRLSFLEGNYVTLTNLSEQDIERICRLKISPVNVSVHVTDPELRCKMLNNRFAGKLLGIMKRFAGSGIFMNAQIVLCKDINDGAYLDKTIWDLKALYPQVQSISAVPVGLTAYREGLYPLEGFEAEDCIKVIHQVENHQKRFLNEIGTRLVYLADEFYIKAGVDLPDYEAYEDFPQIENGVGLMKTFEHEIMLSLKDIPTDKVPAKKSVATGEIAYDYIKSFTDKIHSLNKNTDVEVYKIKNNFFGGRITVTGLVCGCDIIEQLKGKPLGEYLLLSQSMFKSDCDIMLDDTTKEELEKALGVKVIICDNTGENFVKSVLY